MPAPQQIRAISRLTHMARTVNREVRHADDPDRMQELRELLSTIRGRLAEFKRETR